MTRIEWFTPDPAAGLRASVTGLRHAALWACVGLLWAAGAGCTPSVPSGNDNNPPAGNDNTSANDNSAGNDNAADDNGNDNTDSTIEPIFPESYRETYTEVRSCRTSFGHGGVQVRVFANEIAAPAYLAGQNPMPAGSVLVKEEFGGPECSDDSLLVQWRAMRKEAPGFDDDDSDWHWQRVLVDGRQVAEDTKASCIGCHRTDACVARDYMCTEP